MNNMIATQPDMAADLANVPFQRTIEAVVERVADLLHAEVVALDGDGTIIASTEPGLKGRPVLSLNGHREAKDSLHATYCIERQWGEMLIYKLSGEERISPRLAQTLVDLLISNTLSEQRPPNRQELKNQLISDLLHGQIKDKELIYRQAETLGLDLAPPRAVILIDAADYILGAAGNDRYKLSGEPQRRAQLIISSVVSFFHLPDDLICAYTGQGQVVVLKASNRENLADWAERNNGTVQSNGAKEGEEAEESKAAKEDAAAWADLSALKRATEGLLNYLPKRAGTSIGIGIGRYHPGILGLARSYEDARVALSLGRRLDDSNRVHCLSDLGIAAFIGIADERTKTELAAHLLSPLDDEPDLLETLTAFFANNCCHSVTASQLSIHRNTLSYRLERVASLAGLDPRCFDDAVQIRLALLLRELSNK